MAPMTQRSGSGFVSAAVLVVVVSAFLDVTHAVEWIVGGSVAKWSYLHASSAPSFYSDWAEDKTFTTGDSLIFEYDNATHTVMQLATGLDFTACNLKAAITRWTTGNDSAFISKAGTYYYVCGAPSHCEQGMKFSITATGAFVAPPVGSSNGTRAPGPISSHAFPTAIYSYSTAVSIILAATIAVVV